MDFQLFLIERIPPLTGEELSVELCTLLQVIIQAVFTFGLEGESIIFLT